MRNADQVGGAAGSVFAVRRTRQMKALMRPLLVFSLLYSLATSCVPGRGQSRDYQPDPLLGWASGPPNDEIGEIIRRDGSARLLVPLRVSTGSDGSSDLLESDAQAREAKQRLLTLLGVPSEPAPIIFKYVPCVALAADEVVWNKLRFDDEVRELLGAPTIDYVARPALDTSRKLIGADKASGLNFSGKGQTLAIVDNGFDSGHGFLNSPGKIVLEACYSTEWRAEKVTSVCPDGKTESEGPGSADVLTPAVDPMYWHGTHVAGVAAGSDPSSKYSGIASDSDLILIQAFSSKDGDPCPVGMSCLVSYVSDQIRALERVLDLVYGGMSVAAVNLSLGVPGRGYEDQDVCDKQFTCLGSAIDLLRAEGTATVVSAGNAGLRGGLPGPACISKAISVGASRNNNTMYDHSNTAAYLSLMAPGFKISAAFPGSSSAQLIEAKSGTSMAAPHVSGAFAVLRQAAPKASVGDLLNVLRKSGAMVATPISKSGTEVDLPRVDICAALDEIGERCP